jgi:hypothetical protein
VIRRFAVLNREGIKRDVMCYARSSTTLSWLGILWGVLSLVTLLTAFVSNVWLFTREPVRLPNSDVSTTVTFRIGLWRVCPSVRRANVTQRKYYLMCQICSVLGGIHKLRHPLGGEGRRRSKKCEIV